MKFYGNEVCCASYACLNAMEDRSIDLPLFEASTTTPFGIRHCKNQSFDRLLTTFCDPNKGLDNALDLWGYAVSKECFYSEHELIRYLNETLPVKKKVVLGPIDMGGLHYQAVPMLFTRMDHYIVLEFYSDRDILCIDSEGFYLYRINYEQLVSWIHVEEIPEAAGKVTLRHVEKVRTYDRNNIIYHTLIRAAYQLDEAERVGQGSNAVYKCCVFLNEQNLLLWKLSFLYDLQYLKQRKNLFQWFLSELQSCPEMPSVELLRSLISSQEALLGEIYFALRWENHLDCQKLYRVGELENNLAETIALFVAQI